MVKLAVGQIVVLNLGGVRFGAVIEKVSYTAGSVWYSILLDNGARLHGVDSHLLSVEPL